MIQPEQIQEQVLTLFKGSGFALGANYEGSNIKDWEYMSYSFKKHPRFFDVVDCSAGPGVYSHDLAVAPTMMIAKRTDIGGDWYVYEFSRNVNAFAILNSSTVGQSLRALGERHLLTPNLNLVLFLHQVENTLFICSRAISLVLCKQALTSDWAELKLSLLDLGQDL